MNSRRIWEEKLHHNGGIKFCWMSRTLGNIFDTPFIDIWTGPEAREMREFIRARSCNCSFDCDIFKSLALPLGLRAGISTVSA